MLHKPAVVHQFNAFKNVGGVDALGLQIRIRDVDIVFLYSAADRVLGAATVNERELFSALCASLVTDDGEPSRLLWSIMQASTLILKHERQWRVPSFVHTPRTVRWPKTI
jgi:hypothetical protein